MDRGARGRHELAALGPAYLASYLEFLADGEVSAIGRGIEIVEPRRAAVRQALRVLPRTALQQELERLAGAASSAGHRLEGLRLLARIGDLEDVPLLARLAAGDTPRNVAVDRDLQAAFTDALGRLVRRDPDGASALPSWIRHVHPGLFGSFIEGVGVLADDPALPLLLAMMGRGHELDALVLVELAGRRPDRGLQLDEDDLGPVRAHLAVLDRDLAALAATAAAALDDQAAVELLVPLVRESDGGLNGVVAQALERLTGRAFGPDAELWQRWLDEELRWWNTSADAAAETLSAGSAEDAARVVGEMAGLRLRRDELAGILALGLRRSDSDVVGVTCRTLADLGSWIALPGLVEVLRSGPAEVRAEAHDALVRPTGENHAAEAAAWEPLLDRPSCW